MPVQDNLLGSIHIPTSARHNSFKFWKKKSTYHLSGSTQQPLQAQAHFLNCGRSHSLLRANGEPLKWKSSHFQHYKDKTNTCLSHHTIKELTPYTFNITKH